MMERAGCTVQTRDPGHICWSCLAAADGIPPRSTSPNFAPLNNLYRISPQPRPASCTWLHQISKLQRVNAGQCVRVILARLMSRARQNLLSTVQPGILHQCNAADRLGTRPDLVAFSPWTSSLSRGFVLGTPQSLHT
ncbi:hypothetical protein PMIN04_004329 [Paraphaeosphaeria minitans]